LSGCSNSENSSNRSRIASQKRRASVWCCRQFGDRVVAEVEAHIHKIVEQIREAPESAPQVVDRPGVNVVELVRYPYKLFYRILGDTVRILHIRNTSQRPWRGKD
jgi:plasmid stabilization system protein ParE